MIIEIDQWLFHSFFEYLWVSNVVERMMRERSEFLCMCVCECLEFCFVSSHQTHISATSWNIINKFEFIVIYGLLWLIFNFIICSKRTHSDLLFFSSFFTSYYVFYVDYNKDIDETKYGKLFCYTYCFTWFDIEISIRF